VCRVSGTHTFEPRLVPTGARRAGGLDDMIISLYAGGMTVRDISHHLARTIGTELSHDTISKRDCKNNGVTLIMEVAPDD
jgi:transposase-like protein